MTKQLALYEIAAQYQDLLNLNDMDLPEKAVKDTLEGLKGELEMKAISVAAYFQNLDGFAQQIKAAEERMAAKRKAVEKRVKSIKDYLKTNMEATNITRIQCPEYTISVVKSTASVQIDNPIALPDKFVKYEPKILRADIKKAIDAGADVPGAKLKHGTHLLVR